MTATWKTVRVFISSTFRDMHAERDHLVKVVFPAVRERLEKHRIYLIDIDLRWGVTREQAENDQALDLCLRQVDECRPFFIGILGERYGWVPTRFPSDALKRFGWIQRHTGKSVTELEFLHGVLQNSTMRGRAFFYFRDPVAVCGVPEAVRREVFAETDSEAIRKLEELKRQIRFSGYPVMENYPARWDAEAYDRPSRSHGRLVDLEAFGERVRDQLWQAIQEEFQLPEQPAIVTANDPLAEEQDYHERFMESRLRVYVGRDKINDALLAFVNSDDQFPCLVTGPSGSGKSAALARFICDYRQKQPQTLVIPHFVGASPHSTNLRDILRRFCQVLKARFGFADEVPEETAKLSVAFRQFVGKVLADSRVVLVIDALNQLDDVDRAQELYWLPTLLPPQVKVIVSCVIDSGKTEPALDALRRRTYSSVQLPALSGAEQHLIIREVPSLSAKTLDDDQVRLLLKNPATTNPLFLLVALEELRGFAPFERLNERIAALPREGDTVTAIFVQVIERLSEEFNQKLVETVLTLLASARRGLSERELQDLIAGFDGVDELFPVLRQLRPYLLSRGGLIDFYHRNLYKAVRERYLPSDDQQRKAHLSLADFFERQDLRRPLPRPTDELPWQLWQAHAWERLRDLLSYLPFFATAWNEDQYSVKVYWTSIEQHSTYRLLDAYRPILDETPYYLKYVWEVATILMDMGHPVEALKLRAHITELDRRESFKVRLPRSLCNQAVILHQQGDLDGALILLKEQEELCRQSGDDQTLAASLVNQALILEDRGNLDEALRLYQEQEPLFRKLDDHHAVQVCLGNQASLLIKVGCLEQAMELLIEQEKSSRQMGDLFFLQGSLGSQGIILKRNGDLLGALARHKEEEDICRRIGYKQGLQESLGNQGLIAQLQGDLQRALALFVESEQLSRQLGAKENLAISLGNQARVLILLNSSRQALDLIREQEQLYSEMDNKNALIDCYRDQAEILLRQGDLDGAVRKLKRRDELSAELAGAGQLAAAQQLSRYGIRLPVDPIL